MRRALFALAVLKRMEGKVDDERSSLPLTAAIRLHCAAVHFDEILYDGQPESQPAMLPPCRSIGLTESLEKMGQKIADYPFTGVGDTDFHV